MLRPHHYFAFLLTSSLALPAYGSDTKTESKENNQEKPVETLHPDLTVTICAVYAGPEEPKFPRPEVSQALMHFMDKCSQRTEISLCVRVGALLEKFPAGQENNAVTKLLSLKTALKGAVSLLEKMPSELAWHALCLLEKQGPYASQLVATLSRVQSQQLVSGVNNLLTWPEGRIKETLAAAQALVKKHSPTPMDQKSKQMLLDLSLILFKPMDARGHERAQTLYKFESDKFSCFMDIARKLPPEGELQDQMIGILSQLQSVTPGSTPGSPEA